MFLSAIVVNIKEYEVTPCITRKNKVVLEYAMQAVVQLHSFKALPHEWSSLHHNCLTTRERYTSARGMGGWVGSRVSVDVLETRKLLFPCQESSHTSASL